MEADFAWATASASSQNLKGILLAHTEWVIVALELISQNLHIIRVQGICPWLPELCWFWLIISDISGTETAVIFHSPVWCSAWVRVEKEVMWFPFPKPGYCSHPSHSPGWIKSQWVAVEISDFSSLHFQKSRGLCSSILPKFHRSDNVSGRN